MTLRRLTQQTDSQTVYSGGDVYSSADPFATAIAVDGDSVVWVGGDEAAATMAGAHVDAAEDFITPGLATAALELDDAAPVPADLVASGILHAHVIGTPDRLAGFLSEPSVLRVTAYELSAHPGAGHRPALEATDVAGLEPADPGLAGLFLQVRDPAGLAAVRSLLADRHRLAGAQRHGWRLRVTTPLDAEAVEALGASGLGVTIAPAAAEYPVESLLAAGAQLSFELDPRSPWESLRAGVFCADGTSGRAAFNCATRFVHRAAGDFTGSVLAPGSAAELVRWRTGPLVVQAADARIAAWSTDPRSGTAGLPDLTPGRDLPAFVEAYADGVRWGA